MFRLVVLFWLSAALALAAGCSTNIERGEADTPSAASAPAAPPADPAVAVPTPPSGAGAPTAADAAPGPGGAYEAQRREIAQLEAAYTADPSNASAKAKLISAKYAYASKLMEDPDVPPRQKYRPALLAFNEILKLDPGHKEAAAKKEIIEQIYRSMGMPVPP